MKNQLVATITAFRLSPLIPMAIALSFGVTALAVSMGSVASAIELLESVPDQVISQSTVIESADQEKPTTAASDSNTQPASPISSQLEQPISQLGTRKDDQVKIEDIPEACRTYFPPNGSVNLFDYQQRLKLCKYGR